MKSFAKALGIGFLAEFGCAFVGFLGAIGSDTLGRIATVIHTPSELIARLVFSQSGRSTIYRDIAFLFVTQWLIYTSVIFAVLLFRQHHKRRV